jgi:holdfast attachment protein HfaA
MVSLIKRPRLLALAGLAAIGLAGAAQAQTMYSNSATYNAGYGRTPDQENQAVNVSMRDVNGNLTIVDGVIETGQDSSVFASGGATGTGDVVAGVGTQSNASAIGNNLVVVTEGNNNTVIVNSTQTNSGNVTASSSATGGNNGH